MSRDVPTSASASPLMVAISWRTSVIAGPASCSRTRTSVRMPSAEAIDAAATTMAASAITARLNADTTPTQGGSIR